MCQWMRHSSDMNGLHFCKSCNNTGELRKHSICEFWTGNIVSTDRIMKQWFITIYDTYVRKQQSRAIKWVLVVDSRDTLVLTTAWHDGHVSWVRFGPTFTGSASNKRSKLSSSKTESNIFKSTLIDLRYCTVVTLHVSIGSWGYWDMFRLVRSTNYQE